jgi:hypothetical protein
VAEIDIVYAYGASDDERSQVEAWIAVNECSLVSRIWISATAVSMDGLDSPLKCRTGAALRHGNLSDELTEAHLTLGRAIRWH